MKKEFNVLPPSMPNFVRFEKPAGLRQEGIKLGENYHIKNFTQEEAEEYGELMKQTFLQHWKNFQEHGRLE